MKDNTDFVKGTTCFAEHEKRSLACQKRTCRQWIDNECSLNCTILKARETHTLQEIGDMFGVTRMRICQLEKSILAKVEELDEIVDLNPFS